MKLSLRCSEAAASLKACHPLSKHLNMYHIVHSAFHWLDAQARCLPSLPKLLPEAQFEIIKRVEGVPTVWRSRLVSLLPSLSICHAAAGSRPYASKLSAQIQIISLSLNANSHHVAMNTTLLPPCSTHSLTWVWHESNDGGTNCMEIRFFIWGFGLIQLTSLCISQNDRKKLQVSFFMITFPGSRGNFIPRRYYMCSPLCSVLVFLSPDWKTNGPRGWWGLCIFCKLQLQ